MRVRGWLTIVACALLLGVAGGGLGQRAWIESTRPYRPGDVFEHKIAPGVIGVIRSDGQTIYVNGNGKMSQEGFSYWNEKFDPALWERDR